MQYCSLQHCTLLSPPDTSTVEHHFCFSPAASFFLELLVNYLCSSPVAYWIPSHLGFYLPVSYLFAFSYYLWGSSHNKNDGVVCHFLLWQAIFCQNSSLWPVYLGWPCMTWLIASLSYASPFTMTRL